MNFQELSALLKEHYEDNVSEFAYDDSDSDLPGIGKMSEVAQEGGEGEGETWFSVKHFLDHDIYVRIDGSYASYSGTDFEDWDDAVKEVRPQEKTITVYE